MEPLLNEEKIEIIKKFYEQYHEVQVEYADFWLKETFLNWDFWLSIILTVLPWLIWILIRKKESTQRLLFAGFFVIIISSWFDFLGITLHAWYYAGKAIPTIPTFIPWDFTLMPVTIMLFIQYKPMTSPWLKGLIFATLSSFVGETVLKLLGLYVEVKWNSFYSFPIYLLIYLTSDWLTKRNDFDKI